MLVLPFSRVAKTFVFWLEVAALFATPIVVTGLAYRVSEHAWLEQFEAQAAMYAARLSRNVNALLVLNRTLAIVVRQNRASVHSPYIQSVIDESKATFPFIKSIQLLPEGDVAMRTGEKEELLPADSPLSNDPVYRADDERAIELNEPQLLGPIVLKNGRKGLVVRTPVYLDEMQTYLRFWGFVQTLVSFDSLLESSGFSDLDSMRSHYQLWKSDRDSGDPVVMIESGSSDLKNSMDHPVDLPLRPWWVTIENPPSTLGAMTWQGVFVCTLLLSMLMASLRIRARHKSDQLREAHHTLAERANRVTGLLSMYQDVFDATDSGLIVWSSKQRLETWNFLFEKMYPQLAESLHKGMTRRELHAIREKVGEISLMHDWESVGTWYRNLPDGRIIMLKRSALPDGGRLEMHTDMTKSLGDDEQ